MNSPPRDRFSALATAFCVPCIQATGTAFTPLYRGYRRISFCSAIVPSCRGRPSRIEHGRLTGAPFSINRQKLAKLEISLRCRKEILARRVAGTEYRPPPKKSPPDSPADPPRLCTPRRPSLH